MSVFPNLNRHLQIIYKIFVWLSHNHPLYVPEMNIELFCNRFRVQFSGKSIYSYKEEIFITIEINLF